MALGGSTLWQQVCSGPGPATSGCITLDELLNLTTGSFSPLNFGITKVPTSRNSEKDYLRCSCKVMSTVPTLKSDDCFCHHDHDDGDDGDNKSP